jgi:regulator of replication initiation timing
MTEEDKKLLTTFEARLRHFMYLHDELKHENARLKTLLSEKEAQLNEAARQNMEWEARYTDLKMARVIGVTDRDIADTKQRLAKLVREVDKCIALLNE